MLLCFRLVNTVQWGMHTVCMGKVHVNERLGKGVKQKYNKNKLTLLPLRIIHNSIDVTI